MQTPSSLLQNQQKEFEDFFWERGKYKDRKLGIREYKNFLDNSHRVFLSVLEEWAKEKTDEFHLGGEFDEGYKKAMDDLLEFLQT